jgi:hypothetical protein
VFIDPGFNQLRPELPDRREGTGLILAHEAAIPDHIGRKDSGKAAFLVIVGHRTMISISPGSLTPLQAPLTR